MTGVCGTSLCVMEVLVMLGAVPLVPQYTGVCVPSE